MDRRDLTGARWIHILVNKNGERFIDETIGEMAVGNAILDQVEKHSIFMIKDLYDSATD